MQNDANGNSRHLTPTLAWIAAIMVILSLLIPLLPVAATQAAPADDDPLDHATICDDGFVWGDESQQCEPPPDIPTVPLDQDQSVDCADGQVPNGNGGCIPDQQPNCPDGQVLDDNGNCQPLPPPPCPGGTVLDENGNCIPDQKPEPPKCEDGFVLDKDWACVPDPNIKPKCEDGEIYDQDVPGCVPDPDVKPECKDGFVLDEDWACVPDPDIKQPECKDGEVYDQDAPGCVPQEPAQEPASDCPDVTALDESTGKCVSATETPSPQKACPTGEAFDKDTGTCLPTLLPPPPPGPNQIVVTKFACPAGTDPESTIDVLAIECTIDPGVDFTVYDFAGGFSSTKTTDAAGQAFWFGLADTDDGWSVEETVPAMYGRPVIFWRQTGGIPTHHPPDEWIRYGNSFVSRASGIHVGPGWGTQELSWFNFQAADQGVMLGITKHDCPVGTPRDLYGWRNYEMICTPGIAGVEFILTTGSATTIRFTGPDGTIVWGDIPIGPWSMQEILHVGDGEPVVRCRWLEPPATSGLSDQPEPMNATHGEVSGTFTTDHHGLSRWCHWMNIPLELPDTPVDGCGVSSPCPILPEQPATHEFDRQVTTMPPTLLRRTYRGRPARLTPGRIS